MRTTISGHATLHAFEPSAGKLHRRVLEVGLDGPWVIDATRSVGWQRSNGGNFNRRLVGDTVVPLFLLLWCRLVLLVDVDLSWGSLGRRDGLLHLRHIVDHGLRLSLNGRRGLKGVRGLLCRLVGVETFLVHRGAAS